MKKNYVTQVATVTKVELESSICNASVNFEVLAPHQGADVEAQTVNEDFGGKNNFSGNNTWDYNQG